MDSTPTNPTIRPSLFLIASRLGAEQPHMRILPTMRQQQKDLAEMVASKADRISFASVEAEMRDNTPPGAGWRSMEPTGRLAVLILFEADEGAGAGGKQA